MYNRVKAYIEKNRMLEGIGRVVVGLSGGADSVCLLLMLQRYIAELSVTDKPKLIAVHVHHGIRGADADADARFCKSLCQDREIDYMQYSYDVPRLAEECGVGEEEMGRILRYQAFRENIENLPNNVKGVMAVAHHQNDQAETVLFHIARGSSVAGGRGMEPVAGDVIRPLLCVSRREIEGWLSENNVPFCTDNTNFEAEYARNAIRLKVIPYLEEHVNGGAVANICRYAQRMALVDDYIKMQTGAAYEKYVISDIKKNIEDKNSSIVIEQLYDKQDLSHIENVASFMTQEISHPKKEYLHIKKELLNEHPVIINAVIYDALKSLCGAKDLEDKHVAACVALFERQSGRSINLPKNIIAKRDYEGIVLLDACNNRNDTDDGDECMILKSVIRMDADDAYEDVNYAQLLENIIDKNLMNDNCTKYFDYGKIRHYIVESGDELVMRHRAEGDYMIIGYAEPEHRERKKKLKEIFIDSKVPADSRGKVWLCAIGSRVLWAAGVRRCADFLVDRDTRELLKLELKQKEK